VVHSNSFIEGPFDGTGPEAAAVDRAAGAGILWFNSAGNYAELHRSGPWSDADGDDVLDLDGPAGPWSFERRAGQPVTFAVSWRPPPGGTTDLDIALERQAGDGTWEPVAQSASSQVDGARPSETIVGYIPPATALHRLVVRRVSGPPPEGDVTIFSREIRLAEIGGRPLGSIPTPGDAAGSVTIGAVDWRGDAPKAYSSWGPTDDGRPKPELVAPTNTSVAGPNGVRGVGGTSNAAPNAAGAAAVVMAALRRAGRAGGRSDVLARLLEAPLDLGPPGEDPRFGRGRVRVETDPPWIRPEQPAGGSLRGRASLAFEAVDASRISRWSMYVDAVPVALARTSPRTVATVDSRRFPDGLHRVRAEAVDAPGNTGAREWGVWFDNTAPRLAVRALRVLRPPPPRARGLTRAERLARRRTAPRRLRVKLLATDARGGPLRVGITALDRRGRARLRKALNTRPTTARWILAGTLQRGRYRIVVVLRDRAGNRSAVTRRLLVR
jgi:Subtilase family